MKLIRKATISKNENRGIVSDSDLIHGIPVRLTPEQHELLKKLADLQDLEDWQLVLQYVQTGLQSDTEAEVRNLLDIEEEALENLIDSLVD